MTRCRICNEKHYENGKVCFECRSSKPYKKKEPKKVVMSIKEVLDIAEKQGLSYGKCEAILYANKSV